VIIHDHPTRKVGPTNLRTRRHGHRAFQGTGHAPLRQPVSNHLSAFQPGRIQTIQVRDQSARRGIKPQTHNVNTHFAPLAGQFHTTDKSHTKWHTLRHTYEPGYGVVVRQRYRFNARLRGSMKQFGRGQRAI